MLTSEIKAMYQVDGCYSRITRMDDLFSESINDPIVLAEMDMFDCKWNEGVGGERLPHDVVVAVCPNGNVVTQVVVFRNYEGYDKYLADGIVIFDDKEI